MKVKFKHMDPEAGTVFEYMNLDLATQLSSEIGSMIRIHNFCLS